MTARGEPNESAATGKRAAGKRAAGKARTRATILAGGAQVFAERGYGQAALEEIARVSGVAIGSVYAHFKNKHELFLAILETQVGSTLDRTGGGRASSTAALGEGPRAVQDLLAKTAHDHQSVLINTEAWLYAARHDDELSARLTAHHRWIVEQTRAVLAERRHRATALPFDDDELALVVVAVFDGLHRQRALLPERMPDDLLTRVLRLLSGEVAPGPSERSRRDPPPADGTGRD